MTVLSACAQAVSGVWLRGHPVHPWGHSPVVPAPSLMDLDDLPPAQWDALLWTVFPDGPLERLTPRAGGSMTGTSTPATHAPAALDPSAGDDPRHRPGSRQSPL